jgi:hypothetical protein
MLNPYIYAHVSIELSSLIPDESSNWPRADYVNAILKLAESAIQELNITDETTDLDELLSDWCRKNDFEYLFN